MNYDAAIRELEEKRETLSAESRARMVEGQRRRRERDAAKANGADHSTPVAPAPDRELVTQ